MGLEVTGYIPDTHVAWVEWDEDVRFQLRFVGTDEAEAVLMDKAKTANLKSKAPKRKGVKSADETEVETETQAKMMVEYITDGILLDWEGLTFNGDDFPYSKENAQKILKEAKDIRDWVYAEANDISNFKEYDDLKNSESGEKND